MRYEYGPNGNSGHNIESEYFGNPQSTYTKTCLTSWQRFEHLPGKKAVTINRDKVADFATEIYANEFPLPAWNYRGVFPESDNAFMAQILFSATQNFAYSIPDEIGGMYKARNPIRSSEILDGAYAMQSRVFYAFGERDDVTTEMLKPIFQSEESLAEFYEGENTIPHLDLRMETGLDFIGGLDHYFEGSAQQFLSFLTQEEHTMTAYHQNDKPGIVDTVLDIFPVAFGTDVSFLNDDPYPFHKRAQLVAVEYHGRQQNSTQLLMPIIKDIELLGIPVDYEIPKNLREKGILEYSDELAYYVDNWIEIPKDTALEVQIRGGSLAASEEIFFTINALRDRAGLPIINRVPLDYFLWSVGTEMKNSYPHLTRTSAY